jgi:ATP-dependent Clp protease protease subunit
MISTSIDNVIKHRKIEELVDMPVIIRVNKFDEESTKVFASEFDKACNFPQPVVPIIIDSYGGLVDSLMAMASIIESSSKPVATIVDGKAMSCGACLLAFGTEGMRFMAPHARLMIHEIASGTWGKVNEIKADAKELSRLNKFVFRKIAARCGKSPRYFLDIIHKKNHADWYLTAEEAKSHNLVNHIRMPEMRVSISASFEFR